MRRSATEKMLHADIAGNRYTDPRKICCDLRAASSFVVNLAKRLGETKNLSNQNIKIGKQANQPTELLF
jgi:hypothetical protein